LHNNGLSNLPAQLTRLSNLTALHLQNNLFSSFPAEALSLASAKLRQISLAGNPLPRYATALASQLWESHVSLARTSLHTPPMELFTLTRVQDLDLSENTIVALPIEITQLVRLTHLNLSLNKLAMLPWQLGRMTHLRTLKLDGNPVTQSLSPALLHGPLHKLLAHLSAEGFATAPSHRLRLMLVGEENVGKTSLCQALLAHYQEPGLTLSERLVAPHVHSSPMEHSPHLGVLAAPTVSIDEAYLPPTSFSQRLQPPSPAATSGLPAKERSRSSSFSKNSAGAGDVIVQLPAPTAAASTSTANAMIDLPTITTKHTEPSRTSQPGTHSSSSSSGTGSLGRHSGYGYLAGSDRSVGSPYSSGTTSPQGSALPSPLSVSAVPAGVPSPISGSISAITPMNKSDSHAAAERQMSQQVSGNPLSTDGVVQWEMRVPVDRSELTYKIWDFGGQTIYHSTHSFFLTKHALYLLVLDVSQRPEQSLPGLDYWLHTLEEMQEPHVIVVGTHVDNPVRCYS
jgi:GTPase SAR1 family protein